MTRLILVLNAGSSSIKYALYEAGGAGEPVRRGALTRLGPGSQGAVWERDGKADPLPDGEARHEPALRWLLGRLEEEAGGLDLLAAGHRVVHGGRDFAAPIVLGDEALAALKALSPLAPNHQPHNLAAIHAVGEAYPGVPQIACFDTAFHRSQPRLAQLYALPRRLTEEGVIRYGFHGLSYQHIADVMEDTLGPAAKGRVIVAHLGNGASMCAMQDGRSVATTMGFTALDGLVMGTRCGDLDPGVVLHLVRREGESADSVERLLTKESGLLGVSGLSNDMRDLLASDAPEAKEAIGLYCYRARSAIGALTAELGGLDGLVFTAGVGENAWQIREKIASGLGWLGAALDAEANRAGERTISAPHSRVAVAVIATDEERVIFEAAQDLCASR